MRRFLWLVMLPACFLTEPLGDAPTTTPRAPIILHYAAQPSIANVITRAEGTTLIIPVDADPNVKFKFNIFVDFDPQNNAVPALPEQEVAASPTHQNPRTIPPIDLGTLVDPSRCHQIMVVVALEFDPRSPSSPRAPGGDSIVWWYRPNGNEGACPGVDAGAFKDVTAPDVGSE